MMGGGIGSIAAYGAFSWGQNVIAVGGDSSSDSHGQWWTNASVENPQDWTDLPKNTSEWNDSATEQPAEWHE
ncbi:hypothetical protein CQ476_45 [TM7 phage DolZOral124_53_65]|nr:hypothetical protein CQ476_45 [TM7 phage DolZOral124_53_65]